MRKVVLALGITFILVFIAFSGCLEENITPIESKTIYVDDDGGQTYTSIQDAIDAASPIDTVYVYAGTYFEQIDISRDLSLIGENEETTIIDGNGFGSFDNTKGVINVTADGVIIRGFTIQNSGNHYFNPGIHASSDYNVFSENVINNNFYGIWLENSKYNQITDNKVTNNSHGIYLSGSKDNVISSNSIQGNSLRGVNIFGYSDNNVVSGNDIINNGLEGIYIFASSDNKIFHNNVMDNVINASDKDSNIWDDDYPSGGNYWGDYNGTDADDDGIGDTPYDIPNGDNKDRYPLMNPIDI